MLKYTITLSLLTATVLMAGGDIVPILAPLEEWDFEAVYASIDDVLSAGRPDYSFDTILVRANYNF